MVIMEEESITISIPKTLADKVALLSGDGSREALEDFVTIVLQNYLEENTGEAKQEGDQAVEKRLKDLGYL